MMGLLGYAIPADGVAVGSMNITFPSPQEIMEDNVEYSEKPLVDMNQVFFGIETIQRQIEEEKAKAGLQTSAIPTNEEIASALNTLSKVGLNPYNSFNPLASVQQYNQFGLMNPMMNGLNTNNMYGAFLNGSNPEIAQMFLYNQMAQKQNNLMNYGI